MELLFYTTVVRIELWLLQIQEQRATVVWDYHTRLSREWTEALIYHIPYRTLDTLSTLEACNYAYYKPYFCWINDCFDGQYGFKKQ